MILLQPKERHRSRWYYYTRRKKMQLKQKSIDEATKAKQLIDQASTNDAVHETRDNEITAINKIQPRAIKSC